MVHPATGLPRYAKPGAVGKVVFQLANLQKKTVQPHLRLPNIRMLILTEPSRALQEPAPTWFYLPGRYFFSRPADIFRPSIRTALLPHTASNQRRVHKLMCITQENI